MGVLSPCVRTFVDYSCIQKRESDNPVKIADYGLPATHALPSDQNFTKSEPISVCLWILNIEHNRQPWAKRVSILSPPSGVCEQDVWISRRTHLRTDGPSFISAKAKVRSDHHRFVIRS